MKKLLSIFMAACILLSLPACKKKSKEPVNNNTGSNTTATQSLNEQIDNNDTLVAVSVPAITDNATHEDGTVLFQYTYQSMSLVLDKPQVADKIILDFLNRVDSTSSAANSTKEMAKSAYTGGSNWVPYLYHITYSPMRIDHKVLSLFGNNVVYNGAGHPEKTCVSASYDLLTGDVLTLASIMNKDANSQQFLDLVLKELSKIAKSSYLYDNYKNTVSNRFLGTDSAHDEVWYFTQTGLCFYFAPYEIAPYSSGVITVEIPYGQLKGILHDAYLPLARSSATGNIQVTPFNEVDLSDFSHIAELVTEKEGKMYMLSSDKQVQDIRILYADKSGNYTTFASYSLMPGNGIMLQGSEATLKNMKISYNSGNNTVTIPVIG